MTDYYFAVLVLACVALVSWGFLKRDRFLRYPFLAACVFGLWVLPQGYGLRVTETPSLEALNRLFLMSTLCVLACWLGDRMGTREISVLQWKLSWERLCNATVLLALGGLFFYALIRALPEVALEGKGRSGAAGIFVAYLFFADMLTFAFVIAICLFLDKPAARPALVLFLGLAITGDAIIFGGRRTTTIQFFLTIASALWFIKKKAIPRVAVAIALPIVAVFIFAIGDYRAAMKGGSMFSKGTESDLELLRQTDFTEAAKASLQEGGVEAMNAAYDMAAIAATGMYDFGLYHWNRLVFNYVPSQILGEGFKTSLLTALGDAPYGAAARAFFGYENNPGSTHLGVTDCFSFLWYFGCIKFFLIGYILRRLYVSAVQGHFLCRVVYPLALTWGLLSITHGTDWFVSPWIQMTLFVAPVLIYARLSEVRGRKPHRNSHPNDSQATTIAQEAPPKG